MDKQTAPLANALRDAGPALHYSTIGKVDPLLPKAFWRPPRFLPCCRYTRVAIDVQLGVRPSSLIASHYTYPETWEDVSMPNGPPPAMMGLRLSSKHLVALSAFMAEPRRFSQVNEAPTLGHVVLRYLEKLPAAEGRETQAVPPLEGVGAQRHLSSVHVALSSFATDEAIFSSYLQVRFHTFSLVLPLLHILCITTIHLPSRHYSFVRPSMLSPSSPTRAQRLFLKRKYPALTCGSFLFRSTWPISWVPLYCST